MIILSCLHEVNGWDDAVDIIQKEYLPDGRRGLTYKPVCAKCAEEMKKEDLLFDDEDVATKWMFGEDDE